MGPTGGTQTPAGSTGTFTPYVAAPGDGTTGTFTPYATPAGDGTTGTFTPLPGADLSDVGQSPTGISGISGVSGPVPDFNSIVSKQWSDSVLDVNSDLDDVPNTFDSSPHDSGSR
ncbi:hypothetical protein C5O27_02635 [Gordonia alkanivorans]|nr:hypothetical protein C5O27_02635 [Gordonia alkanivorans]